MIRVNLLPQEARRASGPGVKLDKMKVIPLSVLAITLVACTSMMMIQGANLSSLEQDVAQARADLGSGGGSPESALPSRARSNRRSLDSKEAR